MKRVYQLIIQNHLANHEQMVFIAGPRQVGKTTISQMLQTLTDHFVYLNWDVKEHRVSILNGATVLAEQYNLLQAYAGKPIVVFDEIHKYPDWKNFLKGFYDLYKNSVSIVVTGSSKLNVFRRGGDSMLGRYLLYRVHPFTIAEYQYALQDISQIPEMFIKQPLLMEPLHFEILYNFGGFPNPLIKQSPTFLRQWNALKMEQLLREDIRSVANLKDHVKIELLAEILKEQTGQLLNYTNLAQKVGAALTTIQSWVSLLEECYYCFLIRPWTKNVIRSLLKEPKVYLTDWSNLKEDGQKAENFIACHLLKSVQFWKDNGLGDFDLFFIRDKEQREVDFLVTKDNVPWFLVDVKNSSNQSISKSLYRFHEQLQTKHAFQVVFDIPFRQVDCFSYSEPVIVPVTTFLSQLH